MNLHTQLRLIGIAERTPGRLRKSNVIEGRDVHICMIF